MNFILSFIKCFANKIQVTNITPINNFCLSQQNNKNNEMKPFSVFVNEVKFGYVNYIHFSYSDIVTGNLAITIEVSNKNIKKKKM